MENILFTLTTQESQLVRYVNLIKGQMLFNEGDLCECIGIVINGEIEIISYTATGREIIYNSLNQNMVFGNNLIFSSDPHYKGAVVAKNDAKIGLIYKKDLIYLLQNNENFMLSYLCYQSDTGKQLNATIKLLSIDSAEERLLYYTYRNSGVIRYKSITQLASTLHLQRETLSRLISRLVKEKKIIKGNKVIKTLK